MKELHNKLLLSPLEFAEKFKVRKTDDGSLVLDSLENHDNILLERNAQFFTFDAIPKSLFWNYEEDDESHYSVGLEFSTIEFEGQKRQRNPEEHPFFAMHKDVLIPLSLGGIFVSTKNEMLSTLDSIIQMRALSSDTPADSSSDLKWAKDGFMPGKVAYIPADSEFGVKEHLFCHIGIPDDGYNRLLQAILDKKLSSVKFHGVIAGLTDGKYLSTTYFLGEDEFIKLRLNSMTLEYTV